MSDFPLTLPLSPDSGGEGGGRGEFHAAFYATFSFILFHIASVHSCSYLSQTHPLTAPNVRPRTICFWMKRDRINTDRVMIVAAAVRPPQLISS